MLSIFEKAVDEVTVDYTKYSSLEVCLARLEKLCIPTKDYPYSLIDLTELIQANDHAYNFTINAGTSFSFLIRVHGSFEKVSDSTVRIQFVAGIYKGQVITFTLFAVFFFIFFGVVFLANHAFPFLFFIIFPIPSLFVALKRATRYRNELVEKLSTL